MMLALGMSPFFSPAKQCESAKTIKVFSNSVCITTSVANWYIYIYSHYQKFKTTHENNKISWYCIIPSLRLHHTYSFSSVTSLNDLFSTQVNRVDIFGDFVLNFSNFKNCETGSIKVTK